MKKPYESISVPKEEVLHPYLQKQADVMDAFLKENIPSYNPCYTFANDVVTYSLSSEQSMMVGKLLPELINFCKNKGLEFELTENKLLLTLTNLDTTI